MTVHRKQSPTQEECYQICRLLQSYDLYPRFLISYAFWHKADVRALLERFLPRDMLSIFADSGAFSAFSLGLRIEIEDYASWLHQYADLFDVYATLDVINDPKQTARNQERLEQMGLRPLPAFHVGSPWPVLDDLAARYDYIALGGMVPFSIRQQLLASFVSKAFQIIDNRSRVHGFGVGYSLIAGRFPWHSLDSSTWTTSFRFGTMHVFDQETGAIFIVDMHNKASVRDHIARLRANGIDPALLAFAECSTRFQILSLSVLNVMRMERWMRQRRKQPNEPKIYCSIINPRGGLASVFAGWKMLLLETDDRTREWRLG